MTLPPLFDSKFPSFVKDYPAKDIQVYWYCPKFSQSRYPPGQSTSEACTLICLLVAQRICHSRLQLWSIEKSPRLMIFVAESIIEGNKTHARIIEQALVAHRYLSADEALKFGGNRLATLREWKFRIFKEDIDMLHSNIREFLEDWYRKPKADNLIMLLITGGRTVLFLFQEITDKIILFDSHGHVCSGNTHRGLVIAQAKMANLQHLCAWFINDVLNNCFNLKPSQYELTFLYHNCHHHS
ncbi:uncharacterized protein LOC130671848 [Microplitis mediator]|uniref:uncharacterized protein LOC130671848 n=1 Tax=Microplitis mediator TaxID=375433 RepID=UPI0025546166|nr:uncharacterized protein LOC130671848 [Microplitis mediator]